MKRWKNYIFDLYGTLIDIHTDEDDPALWQWLAGFYECYGASYSPQEIRKRYSVLVRQLEAELSDRTGVKWPEIKLEDVFIRLLTDKAPKAFQKGCEGPSEGMDAWVRALANSFRVLSRRRLSAYSSTLPVLKELKRRGCGVHLLSNAQRVFTEAELRITGTAPFLDSVYISSDQGMKKPQPEFMERLLSEQGLSRQDCVMVGNDFSSDIAIAEACGMDSVFINTFAFSSDILERGNAGGVPVIEDLAELLG